MIRVLAAILKCPLNCTPGPSSDRTTSRKRRQRLHRLLPPRCQDDIWDYVCFYEDWPTDQWDVGIGCDIESVHVDPWREAIKFRCRTIMAQKPYGYFTDYEWWTNRMRAKQFFLSKKNFFLLLHIYCCTYNLLCIPLNQRDNVIFGSSTASTAARSRWLEESSCAKRNVNVSLNLYWNLQSESTQTIKTQ